MKSGEDYAVVEAPVGAQVDAIPEGAKETTVDGKTMFEDEGVYYAPIDGSDDVSYEVTDYH